MGVIREFPRSGSERGNGRKVPAARAIRRTFIEKAISLFYNSRGSFDQVVSEYWDIRRSKAEGGTYVNPFGIAVHQVVQGAAEDAGEFVLMVGTLHFKISERKRFSEQQECAEKELRDLKEIAGLLSSLLDSLDVYLADHGEDTLGDSWIVGDEHITTEIKTIMSSYDRISSYYINSGLFEAAAAHV